MQIYFHGHVDAGALVHYARLLKSAGRLDIPDFRVKKLPDDPSGISEGFYVVFIPVLHLSPVRWGASNPATSLPSYVIDDLNSARARIIFDFSTESGTQQHLNQLSEILREKGVSRAGQVIYLAQNRLLSSVGMIRVVHFDAFIVSVAHEIEKMFSGAQWSGALESSIAAVRSRDKLLLCLNATPRAHRLHACAGIVRSGLISDSLVSFPSFDYAKSVGLSADGELERMSLGRLKSHASAARLFVAGLPYVVDEFSEVGNSLVNKIDINPYCRTSVSLVTETGVSSGVRRITEKSYKAVALGHIPIIYGHERSIDFLRDFGFDVFDGLVSHGYDNVSDPVDRLEFIEKELIMLASKFKSGNEHFFNDYSRRALGNLECAKKSFLDYYVRSIVQPVVGDVFHGVFG